MRKRIIIILLISIILFFIYMCYNVMGKGIQREGISKIEISFDTFNGAYSFCEKENIDIALDNEKYLRTYISPKGTFGVYQTVEYRVFYDNGKVITKKHKNVYPVNEIFKTLFSSEEYKKQAIYLFKDEVFDIDKLTLYIKPISNNRIEINDKEVIKNIIISLREYNVTKENMFNNPNNNHINTIEVELLKGSSVYGYYCITPDNLYGVEVLKKAGVYDNLVVLADDIEYMTIFNGDIKVDISDKELFQLVIDKAGRDGSGTTVMRFNAKTKAGFEISGNFYRNQVPKEIENLF